MKRLLGMLIVCMILVFGLAAISFAKADTTKKGLDNQQKVQMEDEQEGVAEEVYAKEGFIVSISSTSIVINKKNMEQKTFTIDANTKICKVGGKDKTALLTDLKAGMRVLVKYDSSNKALSICKFKDKKVLKEKKVEKKAKKDKALKEHKTAKSKK